MSRSLLLAAPSVPIPTLTPALRYSTTGAVPLESFMLLSGLFEMPTLRCLSTAISSSLIHTPCAPMRGRRPELQAVENRDGPHLVPLLRHADLRRRFGEMDLDGNHQPLRERADGAERLGIERVDGMRRDRWRDQVVAGRTLSRTPRCASAHRQASSHPAPGTRSRSGRARRACPLPS